MMEFNSRDDVLAVPRRWLSNVVPRINGWQLGNFNLTSTNVDPRVQDRKFFCKLQSVTGPIAVERSR